MSNRLFASEPPGGMPLKLASLVCCCLMVSIPLSAWSQLQPIGAQGRNKELVEQEHSAKVKSELQKRGTGEKVKVKVTLRDGSKVKGHISRIGDQSFEVTDRKSGRVTTLKYQDVDKVRKPGLSTGAKIGIAAAAAGGILVAIVLGSLAASGE